VVDARGRSAAANATRGTRIFGFKAHFSGPADDCVELYFFRGLYVGLNCVEGGITNVCGLGPENMLREKGFDMDAVVDSCDPLRRRLEPLARVTKWLTAGPLLFRNQLDAHPPPLTYPAGDALSFVDPFTGSGLLSAAITGELAGRSAAEGASPADYLSECRRALSRPFAAAALLRNLAGTRAAEYAATLIPGELLYRITRPRLST
jgi:Dehydrogenases (flavoproteins)